MKKNIANFISLSSLVIAMFFLTIYLVTGDLIWALIGIIIHVILDTLDGYFARKYNSDGDFGLMIDSFNDFIIFGGIPFFVLLNENLSILSFIVAIFYLIMSLLRLARFNITTHENQGFYKGLPTTVAGPIVILSILLINNYFLILIIYLIVGYLQMANFTIKKPFIKKEV